MTLPPPKRRDPRVRTPVPLSPPAQRTRAAIGLDVAARHGAFRLQRCGDCRGWTWPPRDACPACLSVDLRWEDHDPSGEVIAETAVNVSTNAHWRERLPARVGTVRLPAGLSVIAHLHGRAGRGDAVTLAPHLDRSGHAVMVAVPDPAPTDVLNDPLMRLMTCDPLHRRILITDARAPVAAPLARALLEAGAAEVHVGRAETWLPPKDAPDWEGMGVRTLPLDVTDPIGLREAAGSLGGKVEIVLNTQALVRPGGILHGDARQAREAMDVNVLGLMRVAQAFGPGLIARGEDGTRAACAFGAVLSAGALAPAPDQGAFHATQAAARAVLNALRAEMPGLRVLAAYAGPTDDEWHREYPAPKVAPSALARGIVDGLRRGAEEVFVGEIAQDLAARWRAGPDAAEMEARRGMLA